MAAPKLRRLTEADGEDPLDSTWEVLVDGVPVGCVSAPVAYLGPPREWACWVYDLTPVDPVDELADDTELAELDSSPAEMDDPAQAARGRAGEARFLYGGFTTRKGAVATLLGFCTPLEDR